MNNLGKKEWRNFKLGYATGVCIIMVELHRP